MQQTTIDRIAAEHFGALQLELVKARAALEQCAAEIKAKDERIAELSARLMVLEAESAASDNVTRLPDAKTG